MRKLRVAAALAAATLGLAVLGVSAQSGETLVKITGPAEEVKDGDLVPFDVNVENVDNLGGFQYHLVYNSNLLEFDSFQKGDFAGSTGREVVCNEPVVAEGSVRLSCNTLRPTPAGPDGSGKLMTVLLKSKGAGTTEVTLDRVKLVAVDETATEIPTQVANTSVVIKGSSGFNWLIWGPVIGAGVLAALAILLFGAMRVRTGGTSKPSMASS